MTTLETIFLQQENNEEKAWENIIEVSQVVEDEGIKTYILTERTTIYIAVERHESQRAHKFVYEYWHRYKA